MRYWHDWLFYVWNKKFKKIYKNYRYCLTAVDLENKRSSAIHQRCGFLRIGQLMLNENPGEIILWDIKN